MGAFDYVNFKMNCPRCETLLISFQTKPTHSESGTVEPEEVSRFYSRCTCGAWVEFNRTPPEPKPIREIPLTQKEVEALGFTMTVTKSPF